jgi:Asp-tRNA(Asn)/Glu-tRNA(Gln) amidotransferase C subunit
MDFLFHTLSEKEREDIRKEAKRILDSFSEKLSKVKVSEEDPLIKRKFSEREEKEGVDSEEGFRERIFENAPNKNSDFIIAEKKKWE